jgi:DNA-binding cell septation regulator SpoVG
MSEKGTQSAAIAMDEEFANADIAVIQGGFPLFLASMIYPFV